ncbi:MAG: tetratricopeptide repeat-containing sensor histidine kinase [Bacteroidota bacterium]|nr:tetratricopeptide repeat-containing sensor histidine kinase [Bacteroidota bacterium]
MQRITLHLFLLFFLSLPTFSQNTRQVIDSLLNTLETTEEKNKIELLNNISRNYWEISLDSSLYFANEALNLAHILKDKKGLSDVYNRIGNVYYFQGDYDVAEEFYQKSVIVKKEINDLKGLLGIYNNIAILYNAKNEPEQGLQYFSKALEISKQIDSKDDIALFLSAMGNTYSRLNDYKKSIQYHLQALEIVKTQDNEIVAAQIYNAVGNVYQTISDYDSALKYFLDALKIYKKYNNQRGISMSYNNLGIIYQNLGENEKALDYYLKSLEIDVKNNFSQGQASAYNNLGTAYDKKGEKRKALDYYRKALEINKELHDQEGIAIALNNIGLIQIDLGNYASAKDYLEQALEINNERNSIEDIANNYNNLAKLYIEKKEYNTAKNYLLNSIKLAKTVNDIEVLIEAYEFMYTIFTNQNNYKNALEYYKLYSDMNDSIFKLQNSNKVAELKIKHETENLEIENEVLKKDNEIQLLELNRQINQKKYFYAFIILILTLAILSFSRFRLKKRTSSLLETKNNQLRQTNQKLRESEKNLKKINATKDKFFSIIAHDLKNPFQPLLGFSEVLFKNVNNLSKDEIEEYSKMIFESSQNLFNLLGNLLEWSKSQLGRAKLSPKNINLTESLNETLSILNILAQKKQIQIETKIPEETFVYADKNVLSTILRNLISNSIKFTEQNGKIIIDSTEHKDEIAITVSDNGKGISEENLKNLFLIDYSHSTKGTNDETGTGLGLILCKELISQSGGKIWVNSTLGQGSEFTFTLPKAKK